MRQHARAAAVALAVLAAGCGGCKQRQQEEPEPLPEAEHPETPPTPQRRVGVKVPMPPGWTAQVMPDGSFQFGPPGRPVLRVDLRPGQGPALPSPDELAQSVTKSFQGFEHSVEQKEGGADFSLVQVKLSARLSDGGVGSPYPALFGARRVEKDLFLCATFPEVTADEVHQATEACRGIEFQQPR
ncbi:hypothetical protein [Vitiosangium sp. GDMCC 1.1324]|uniref:hypothetical protein n=1 Tax=Vitiosangium sp. (strain GDMCC 1.1324) TaxID=2138576 RepID=UPI000D353DD2|nr:hypothetical protein [Vitiosangium sp. GDMCC 1.1324]PTL76627.1 hypothetical protein DAT35_49135 [Vitiosangium sp. GDMCC 1.1324]